MQNNTMEVIVRHKRYGTGVIDDSDFANGKNVVVFFDDKTFRQVRSSSLKVIADTYRFLDEVCADSN